MPTIKHLKQIMLNSNVALRYNFISTNLGCAKRIWRVCSSPALPFTVHFLKKKKTFIRFWYMLTR